MADKSNQHNTLLKTRYVLLVIVIIFIMIADVRFKALRQVRAYIETAFYPLLVLVNVPEYVAGKANTKFKSRSELIAENEQLSSQNFMQRAALLRLEALEQENKEMRLLLNSPREEAKNKIFAEVLSVDSDPYLQRLVINRGTSSKVYVGMPVITDQGLVGQVIETNYAFSRILLLVDPMSSIPVVNARNHMRAVASGTSLANELILTNVPRSLDFKVGDLLLSSGLGGVYPEGYPVAVVSELSNDDEPNSYSGIKARPIVNPDKLKYVLLFFYEHKGEEQANASDTQKLPSDDKYQKRQERIKHLIDSLSKSGD